jgi:hypothetical protein
VSARPPDAEYHPPVIFVIFTLVLAVAAIIALIRLK